MKTRTYSRNTVEEYGENYLRAISRELMSDWRYDIWDIYAPAFIDEVIDGFIDKNYIEQLNLETGLYEYSLRDEDEGLQD